jgi:hypothetical protein
MALKGSDHALDVGTRSLDDSARFAPSDPDDLVAASLVCPLCLRRAGWALLEGDGQDQLARCRCMLCNVDWLVAVSPDQYRRLALAAPPHMLVLKTCSATGAPEPPAL